jgi:hypothetical protein
LRRHSGSKVSCRINLYVYPQSLLVQSPLLSAEVAGAFDQIVRAVLHPCSPFSRLFTGAEKGMQIFHIKSQSNYLTSRASLFFALTLHSD